jgi:hypothetical protein
VPAEKKLATTE